MKKVLIALILLLTLNNTAVSKEPLKHVELISRYQLNKDYKSALNEAVVLVKEHRDNPIYLYILGVMMECNDINPAMYFDYYVIKNNVEPILYTYDEVI